MKKLIIFAALFLMFAVESFAAESCVITVADPTTDGVQLYTWVMTSAADGTCSCTATRADGFIVRAVTDPSATAPTADYDIVINDSHGIDVMAGELGNRHTSISEQVVPILNSVNLELHVSGTLTVEATNMGSGKISTLIAHIKTR